MSYVIPDFIKPRNIKLELKCSCKNKEIENSITTDEHVEESCSYDSFDSFDSNDKDLIKKERKRAMYYKNSVKKKFDKSDKKKCSEYISEINFIKK